MDQPAQELQLAADSSTPQALIGPRCRAGPDGANARCSPATRESQVPRSGGHSSAGRSEPMFGQRWPTLPERRGFPLGGHIRFPRRASTTTGKRERDARSAASARGRGCRHARAEGRAACRGRGGRDDAATVPVRHLDGLSVHARTLGVLASSEDLHADQRAAHRNETHLLENGEQPAPVLRTGRHLEEVVLPPLGRCWRVHRRGGELVRGRGRLALAGQRCRSEHTPSRAPA